MNDYETLGEWYWRRNSKYSSLYYLFQNEWGRNRTSEFRSQRLATSTVAQPSAVQEFHRLSYVTHKFIRMLNKFIGHNNIDSFYLPFANPMHWSALLKENIRKDAIFQKNKEVKRVNKVATSQSTGIQFLADVGISFFPSASRQAVVNRTDTSFSVV
jgi:hypothetical protein